MPDVLTSTRGPRRRWTHEAIIAMLRDYAAQGRAMNWGAVADYDSGLATAAYDAFGSWDAALRAAGIDPSQVRLKPRYRRWTREKIVAQIRAYADEGRDLASFAVQKYDTGVNQAAFKAFGSWNAALVAAGLNPESIRKTEDWPPDKVLARIRQCVAEGRDLSSAAMQRSDNKLAKAAVARFGSWHKALLAAGLDAASIRKVRRWSREEILAAIRAHACAGRDLALSSVVEYDCRLYWATFRAFGGWAEALEATGFDPEKSRHDLGTEQHRGTVFENIIREPLAEALGWRTDYCFVREDGSGCWPDLYDPKTGTWADIKIRSWGFSVAKSIENYAKHAPRLLIIYAEGEPREEQGNVSFLHIDHYRSLKATSAWRKAFERIDQLRATPATVPPGLSEFIVPRAPWSDMRWTKALVIERIREYHSQGADLSSGGVRKFDEALLRAAWLRFGSWDAALVAAGLEASQVRKVRNWTDLDVLSAIRGLAEDERTPGRASQANHALYELARRRFGSWENAIRRAGLRMQRTRRRRREEGRREGGR
jgi:hypothetical protein